MIRSLNTGGGGIKNFQTSLDVIANNLANLNTVGFKGGRVDFAEALTQTVRASTPDEGNTSGTSSVAVSNGVATNAVTTLFGQGAINQTGKITDLAWSPRLKQNIGYVWVQTALSQPGVELEIQSNEG